MKFKIFQNLLTKIYQNKNILIFGASKGLGKAILLNLINLNAKIYVVTSSKNCCSLKELNKLETIYLLKNQKSWEDDFENVLKRHAIQFHYVFFNSGITQNNNFENIEDKKIIEIFNVNLFNYIRLLKILTRNNLLDQAAKILSISSGTSILPSPFNSIYAASKAALDRLNRSIALEFESKIKFISVYPGYINTGFGKNKINCSSIVNRNESLYSSPNFKAMLLLLLAPYAKKRIFIPGSYLIGLVLKLLPEKLFKQIVIRKCR